MNRAEHRVASRDSKRRAEIAHDLVWNQGRFATASYAIHPVFEATSLLRFIVFARYTIKVEGEDIRSEGPVAAFVHKSHADLFLQAIARTV